MRAKILSIRPGITDLAALEYFDEAEILNSAADAERAYLEDILPRKLDHDERHVDSQSLWLDLRIIGLTVARVLGEQHTVRE